MSTERCLALTLAGMFLVSVTAPASASDAIRELFPADGFYSTLRWRAEHVDQDPFAKDAFAMPLRVRVGYESGLLAGFSFKIEYDYVADFGMERYNEGGGNTPDRTEYPVIADPAGGDLNQAYLQWRSTAGNRFRAGKQAIVYDNARYIGNVAWRQNEQTFDAVSFERLELGGFDLRAAYLSKVWRIFGDDVPAGENDLDSWIFNLAYEADGFGRAVGYWYDIENDDIASFSTRTAGIRWLGEPLGENAIFGYKLEWATQQDSANSPVSFNADYLRVDLSLKLGTPTIYFGYESLGGDASRTGAAFRTPLATLHAFNGWADKFLITPNAGLVDVFGGVKGPLGAWSWNVLWHDFSAESGSEQFGTELDGAISRKFNNGISLLLKAAFFQTDSTLYGDTRKLWAEIDYSF